MTSQDKARKAYQFLKQRSAENLPFTVDDLMSVTGWKKSTAVTYISKQWRDVIKRQPNSQYVVLPEIQRLTEEAFLQLATQKRAIFASYQRIKYREVVTYEFLLPLTREDQLRKALDELFYKDTVQQRLREIGLSQFNSWIRRNDDESEENYIDRICMFISNKFGGYSISHVQGRYRAAPLSDRENATRMLAADKRYVIDETTASVRFIIPIESTKITLQTSVDQSSFDRISPPANVIEEISQVQFLFFNLFVEAVVRMVEGEDEIWLVEEAGPNRSLYVWEKKG